MEKLHILDKCMLPLRSLKNKMKSLFIPIHWGVKSHMDWVYDVFQDRNISRNLFPHIAYDI